MSPQDVLNFWFKETDQKQWFAQSKEFDDQIKLKFAQAFKQAAAGEFFSWRGTPEGRLAEIIILDQFSRNMFRGSPEAFRYDSMALALSQEAVRAGDDQKLPVQQRGFLYMPHMHSESKVVHEEAVRLFSQKGLEYNLEFEFKHKAIIDRFGHYPHRNQILGRPSTQEELEFLKTNPGF